MFSGPEGHADASVFESRAGAAFLSVDFFTPIVDDAGDWGRIAAQNALSDIWAAGGRPSVALCIAAWPQDRDVHELQEAILGAREILDADGVELGGGHTIIDAVPKLGFCVYGHRPPGKLPPGNRGAKPSDYLVLTKRIGTGVAMTAHKMGSLGPANYRDVVSSMISSNGPAARILVPACNAITDVTGYGIAGHLLHMLLNSECAATLQMESVPAFACVPSLVAAGVRTGGGERVWEYYGDKIDGDVDSQAQVLLSDPQTSGGLLASVPESDVDDVLARLAEAGEQGWVIGRVGAGEPRILAQ